MNAIRQNSVKSCRGTSEDSRKSTDECENNIYKDLKGPKVSFVDQIS